jgi:FixJ family two-component response regulator
MSRRERYVYVIDDDESVRKSFARLLKWAGLHGATFASLEEFFKEPKQVGNCCLLVDMQITGMSGFDFQRNLKEQGVNMPVIAVSASDDARIREQARDLGALSFFRKPIDDQAILDAIWWALSSQRRDGVK